MADKHLKNFRVKNNKEFLKLLHNKNVNLENKVGRACEDLAIAINEKIREKRSSPNYVSHFSLKCYDNIYRNIEKNKNESVEFTVITLNNLLCLFFYKYPRNHKYSSTYTTKDIKQFFECIEITTGSDNDRDTFHKFLYDLELIEDDLNPTFKEVSVEINQDFEFSILGDETNDNDFNNNSKNSGNLGEEDYHLDDENDSGSITSANNSTRKYLNWIIAIIVIIVFISGIVYLVKRKSTKSEQLIQVSQSCLPAENSAKLQAIIYKFKENETIDNSDLSYKIYSRLKNIINRDSLFIDITFCDQFNTHSTYMEALNSDSLFYKSQKKFKAKVYTHYLNEEDLKTHELSIKKSGGRILHNLNNGYTKARKMFNEVDMNTLTYEKLLHILRYSKNVYDNQKAIGYIDNILLDSSLSKNTKIHLLLNRAKFLSKSNTRKVGMSVNDTMISSYQKVLDIDPYQTDALREISRFQIKNKNPQAIKNLRTLVNIKNFLSCNNNYSLAKAIAIIEGDYPNALMVLEETAPATCRNSLDYLKLRAYLKLLNREYLEAVKLFEECYRLDNNDSFYKLHSNYALYRMGKYQEAINNLKNIPNDEASRFSYYNKAYMSLMHYYEGNYDEALKVLNSYLYQGTGEDFTLDLLFSIHFKLDDFINAKQIINKAIKRKTQDPYLYNKRRLVENKLGNKRLARIDSLKIIDDLDPDFYRLKKDTIKSNNLEYIKVFQEILLPH